MAAPSSAFRTKALKQTKDATTIDCLIAIPDATETVLKERFYLDVLLAVDEYDASSNRIAGFIGGCKVGSDNHAFHNANRHFTLNGTQGADQIDFFNDAGLNTLAPKPDNVAMLNMTGGYFYFRASFKPAFWVNSEPYIKYRKQGETVWNEIGVPSVPMGSGGDESAQVRQSHPFRWIDLVTPATIEFLGVNKNAEGEMESFIFTKVVTSNDIEYLVQPTDQYGDPGSNPDPTFMLGADSWDLQIGTVVDAAQLYNGIYFTVVNPLDDETTDPTFNQVYQADSASGQFKIVWIGQKGGSPNPPNEWETRPYHHRNTSFISQCTVMNGGSYNPPSPPLPEIYKYLPNGKWYENKTASGAYATDGFYFTGGKVSASNGTQSWEFYRMLNGEITGYGNCYDGFVIQ